MLNAKKGSWSSASVSREDWAKNMPLWLYEGLPEYISLEVARQKGLPHFDVHSNTNLGDIDSSCKEDFKNPTATYILSFVGKKGAMPELFGKDRRLYAPVFYHCSCSFVKYLSEFLGIEPLVSSLSSYPNEQEEVERRLGSTIDEIKKMWMAKINTR